jgi:hypothetical protein
MPSPIIPWLPSNIPAEIQSELTRRKTARGLNYTSNAVASWDKDTGDWSRYKGPMTAWARVCSNGWGTPTPETAGLPFKDQKFDYPGLVMYEGEEFYTTYGFGGILKNAKGQAVLGWTPKGTPHTLIYDLATSQYPIHVPSPSLGKIEATIQKELYRRVNISWTCFSYKQLEYLTPYLLVPGISVIVEWGWNHFNPNSLLDLTDTNLLAEYWDDPYPLYSENILLSRGNYDVIFGIITNFEWSVEGNVIKCSTEITSKDRLYSGISTNATAVKNNTSEVSSKNVNEEYTPEWFTNLNTLCAGNFITNIVTLSKYKGSIDALSLGASGGSAELKSLCKKLSSQGKENYWRGVFTGRPEKSVDRTGINKKDFDYSADTTKDVWVNMGFLVEIINSCVPIKSISNKRNEFFQVDIDDCPIGGHPNLISTDGSVLLIPNKLAPKYNFNGIFQYEKPQYLDRGYNPQNLRGVPDGYNDELWHADFTLSVVFRHINTPKRDDLDKHINKNRSSYKNVGKDGFEFPFISTAKIGKMEIPRYRYGYFKDLYFNLNEFHRIVKGLTKQDSYTTIYNKIFEKISSACRGYWDLSLVEGSSRDGGGVPTMKVVDSKMIPIRNGDDKPYYFNYGEADSIIQSISFKPALSTAMATRIIFSEQNSDGSKMSISSDGDLLDYQFRDMILSRKDNKDPAGDLQDNNTDRKTALNKTRESLQSLNPPPDGSYPMTINKSGVSKPPPESIQHLRLVLPNEEFLTLLLDDKDTDNNSRYVGVQPNITAEIRLLGIGGLRTFQMFFIRNLPKPYSDKNIVFRIVDIQQEIENGNWITIIRAGIIPLKGSIKKALNVED